MKLTGVVFEDGKVKRPTRPKSTAANAQSTSNIVNSLNSSTNHPPENIAPTQSATAVPLTTSPATSSSDSLCLSDSNINKNQLIFITDNSIPPETANLIREILKPTIRPRRKDNVATTSSTTANNLSDSKSGTETNQDTPDSDKNESCSLKL